VFEFRHATICRGDTPVVSDLSWAVRGGEAWAVVGPSGCGKTTLAEALTGRHRLTAGTFTHHFPEPELSRSVRLVPFREQSRLFSPDQFYYQQRFEFGDPDDCPTVREYLTANRTVPESELADVAAKMRITPLLDLKLLKLSNGQTRRTRLARGLMSHPRLLVLDDPFAGLDVAGRAELAELLGDVVRAGQSLVLVTRADQVPAWVSGVLDLAPLSRLRRGVGGEGVERDSTSPQAHPWQRVGFAPPIIEMRSVSVRHGGKLILDGIDWTVRAGERWAVLGPNGSGKTTLLSLICGDHPQAFANDIAVFGRRRGHGETIWDVKRRVGLVSPELHQYFPRMRTAFDAAATGLFDHLTPQPLTPEQSETITALFVEFGLTALARRPWWQLSTGQQRAVLFVRAVVKRPPLLILDEPFQGMDAAQADRLRNWLDVNLSPDQTLLMVTHHDGELPACVTQRLVLNEGRVSRSD
jgi:molybdate transport system ATP-binding protein